MNAPKHPGGRPPMPPEERLDARLELRMTAAQRDKLVLLGGAAWLRGRIELARVLPSRRRA